MGSDLCCQENLFSCQARMPGTLRVLIFTEQFLPGRQLDVVMAGLCRELGKSVQESFSAKSCLRLV